MKRFNTALVSRKPRRGIALIIVLACVALLSVLVVGLVVSVGTELKSSKTYANGSSVKQLAQSAVNLVMGEIRDATADGTLCWASQPGMIRTYDNTGAAKNYYKLYSDDTMIGTGVFDHTVSNLVPNNWWNQKGVYVDLNQPVSVNGVNQYPILDGDAGDLSTGTSALPPLMIPAASSAVTVMNGATALSPAGFWLNSLTPLDQSLVDPSPTKAPMPVKWLYVLKDGRFTTPDASTGSPTITFANSLAPSAANPIIGRMAFWTDDETAKVNVNTASEGTYWDTPRATSSNNISATAGASDFNLMDNMPVKGEYQRYPGHPAMTSLSAIFPSLGGNPSSVAAQTIPEVVYSVTPRLGPGGSMEGTVNTYNTLASGGTSATAVPLNKNPLFPTVDEFLLQPALSGVTRPLTSALGGGFSTLNQNAVTDAKFFLTANSRAPDVNLFNQPRVSVWPISFTNDNAHRTALDQLIAFCTTVGPAASALPYYFQRSDPTDSKVDLPISNNNTGLNRNRRLLEYLRLATSSPVPGFSSGNNATFAKKYSTSNGSSGTDRDQILTEMFDYIRGATNLRDPSVSSPYTKSLSGTSNGYGQVVPIEDTTTNTRGFGRFYTLQGINFLFIANSKDASGKTTMQMLLIPQFFDPVEGLPQKAATFKYTIDGLAGLQVNGTPVYSTNSYSKDIDYFPVDKGAWGDQFGSATIDAALINTNSIAPFAGATFTFTGGPLTITIYPSTHATNAGTPVQTITVQLPLSASVPTPTPSGNTSVYDAQYLSSSGPYNLCYFTTNNGRFYTDFGSGYGGVATYPNYPFQAFFYAGDVVRSVAVYADPRLVAAQKVPSSNLFAAVGGYNAGAPTSGAGGKSESIFGTHTFFSALGAPFYGAVMGQLVNQANYDGLNFSTHQFTATQFISNPSGQIDSGHICFNFSDVFDPAHGGAVSGVLMGSTIGINIPALYGSSLPSPAVVGDWDNGVAALRDGPFINKPDEGDAGAGGGAQPYSLKLIGNNPGLSPTLFTPNRQIPSAAVFGSLPTGVFANKPWQTLLFRPGPLNHTGLGTSVTQISASTRGTDQGPPYTILPDHLMLDLFTMPVVEPYAISEPLSTAGRVNMNSLIVPFTYINRDTGLRAVLKSEQIVSLLESYASTYKTTYHFGGGLQPPAAIRFPVNIDATLAQFYDRRFNNKDIFRSPSEICDIDIVPKDPTYAAASFPPSRIDMDKYWNGGAGYGTSSGHRLTGDNSRERIYATLYPRLTTKSNTFTIHFRVQTLKQALPPNWAQWREGTDSVTAEYRGSETVERYVDPNDSTLPDFADPANSTATLAPYYKFRVLSVKQFAP